jgi:hypothetical protein
MKNEIDKDFYCGAGIFSSKGTAEINGYCRRMDTRCVYGGCSCYHRKHPTPEQYKEEYGEDVPDDMAVWEMILDGYHKTWQLMPYWGYKQHIRSAIEDGENPSRIICVIACTPFPQPNDKWRPE